MSLDAAAYKWTRWSGLDRPDSVLFALGSNDVYGGAALATIQANHAAVAGIAARAVSPVQYGSTIFRRASGEATDRVAYNTWLQTQPDGLRDVFDFAAAVGSPPNAAYDFDGVHLNDAGQTALLGTITRPLTAGAAAGSGSDATAAYDAFVAEMGA
jgi:lysophospholipase L1-like esterase